MTLGKDYSKKKNTLTETEKELLLETLKTIDPVLCRLLYAMFLTDAYMEGNDPKQWNRQEVLDYVTQRELKRLEFSIRQVMGTETTDRKLYAVCLYLLCMATILQDVSLDILQFFCPDEWKIIESKTDCFETPAEFFNKIGIAVGFAMCLSELLYTQDEQEAKVTIKQLESFLNIYPDELILKEIFACNLANFSMKQDIQELQITVNQLEKLFNDNPHVSKILVTYALGLTNLVRKQDQRTAEKTIKKLNRLSKSPFSNPQVIIMLAISLARLSSKQSPKNRQRTLLQLSQLAAYHTELTVISKILARAENNISLPPIIFELGKLDE